MTTLPQTSTNKDQKSPTQLSLVIVAAMKELGLEIGDLSNATDITYEHARRIVRGATVPSKPVLRTICDVLGLDYNEALKLYTAAKIELKFGGIPAELSGKDPSLVPIERFWSLLSDDQKRQVTNWVKQIARDNEAKA